MKITVEELCQVPGIRHMIQYLKPDEGPFPKTAAYTKKIRFPAIHETYDNSKNNMLKVFELECEGFADY